MKNELDANEIRFLKELVYKRNETINYKDCHIECVKEEEKFMVMSHHIYYILRINDKVIECKNSIIKEMYKFLKEKYNENKKKQSLDVVNTSIDQMKNSEPTMRFETFTNKII